MGVGVWILRGAGLSGGKRRGSLLSRASGTGQDKLLGLVVLRRGEKEGGDIRVEEINGLDYEAMSDRNEDWVFTGRPRRPISGLYLEFTKKMLWNSPYIQEKMRFPRTSKADSS